MSYIESAKKIVVKVGSSQIFDENDNLKQAWLDSFVEDIAELKKEGKQVIIVTSGAIAFGMQKFNIKRNKLKLIDKQVMSLCGQFELMTKYQTSFLKHNINLAQVILTFEDVENRKKLTSTRAVIEKLLEEDIIPVVNENDLIATAEIRFGDNDRLAAKIAQIMNFDLLVLLSKVNGLYSENPEKNPQAKLIKEAYIINQDIETMATDSESGTGGMNAKIIAAKTAFMGGCNVVIANGSFDHPVKTLRQNSSNATWIVKKDDFNRKYIF